MADPDVPDLNDSAETFEAAQDSVDTVCSRIEGESSPFGGEVLELVSVGCNTLSDVFANLPVML